MSSETAGWSAGAATMVFPVEAGTPLEGYAARRAAAAGTHDGLGISALVIQRADQRLVIVTADIAAVDAQLVDEVAIMAGIDRSELVICASHTHSGPAGVVPRLHPAGSDRLQPALRSRFVAICVDAIAAASRSSCPVTLRFGQSDAPGVAANRNDPYGPSDGHASVLAVRELSGELMSLMVHFGCHPTVLGAENLLVSADFPGSMRRALRDSLAQHGSPPVVLFANGAAGDVSTRYTRRGQDFAEMERVGQGLAAAVLRALENARPISGAIRYERYRIRVTPRSAEEASSSDIEAGTIVDAAERRRAETRAQGAALLRSLSERGASHVVDLIDIEAWGIGELALVAIPGELFASLGARIASESPSSTLVLGYANGYVGYLPDEASYEGGTYEALASPYVPGTGESVTKAACELVARLRECGAIDGRAFHID